MDFKGIVNQVRGPPSETESFFGCDFVCSFTWSAAVSFAYSVLALPPDLFHRHGHILTTMFACNASHSQPCRRACARWMQPFTPTALPLSLLLSVYVCVCSCTARSVSSCILCTFVAVILLRPCAVAACLCSNGRPGISDWEISEQPKGEGVLSALHVCHEMNSARQASRAAVWFLRGFFPRIKTKALIRSYLTTNLHGDAIILG